MEFEKLNLHPDLMKSVNRLGYKEPTPIQEKCIPLIKDGKDVVGQSLTGSGKTAAFGLPMLEKVVKGKGLQALVLTPTRELCVQVCDAIAGFGQFMRIHVTPVYGGVGLQPQIDAMKTAEIVVGTPGRILDHLERRTIDLHNVGYLVIDEADKMFEMGFIEDVERIISQTPKSRQTMLFSATMSTMVLNLVNKHLKSPVVVREKIHVDKSLLRQLYYEVPMYDKFSLLVHLLKHKTAELAIVFCGTRHEVDIISRNLKVQGVDVMAVHGGLSQNKRSYAVDALKKSNISVLVATDVAARGLDISNISHIYNYDVPKTPEEYVHRIGRTARAGHKGEAITILTERDHENFRRVLSDRTLQIYKENMPSFQRVRFVVEERRERTGRSFGPRRSGDARQGAGRPPMHRGPPRGEQRESRGSDRPRRSFGNEGSQGGSDKPRYREPHFGSAG